MEVTDAPSSRRAVKDAHAFRAVSMLCVLAGTGLVSHEWLKNTQTVALYEKYISTTITEMITILLLLVLMETRMVSVGLLVGCYLAKGKQ